MTLQSAYKIDILQGGVPLKFIYIYFFNIFAQINNFARLGRKKTNLTKENQAVNSYVKLDIEWNISDFICKEK